MPNTMPTDIRVEIEDVLKTVRNDPRRGRSYLTAHQILDKLPSALRDKIIQERGNPGQGSGKYYAAASVVSDAAEMLSGIEIVFLDSSSLKVMLKDGTGFVAPGSPDIGLYRLK